MRLTPDSNVQQLPLELICPTGSTFQIDAELRYDNRDPYAVTLAMPSGPGKVLWMFGRELLATGLEEPAGDGDVHISACVDADGRRVVRIELCSPDGRAVLHAPVAEVARFLRSAHRAVRPGCESHYVDIDAAITAILSAGAR